MSSGEVPVFLVARRWSSSSSRPSAARIAIVIRCLVRRSRRVRVHTPPQALSVIQRWKSRSRSVARAMLRSTCSVPNTSLRTASPRSNAFSIRAEECIALRQVQCLPVKATGERMGSLWDRETGALIGVPAFRWFAISRACTSTGSNLFQAALLWEVYALSGSPVELGIVGLVRFVPIIALSFVAGAAADTYDRRRVLLVAQLAPFLGAMALLYAIA